jgi:hypothetical protein
LRIAQLRKQIFFAAVAKAQLSLFTRLAFSFYESHDDPVIL